MDTFDVDKSKVKRQTATLKRLIGSAVKNTVNRAKIITQKVSHREGIAYIIDETFNFIFCSPGTIKLKDWNDFDTY